LRFIEGASGATNLAKRAPDLCREDEQRPGEEFGSLQRKHQLRLPYRKWVTTDPNEGGTRS